MWKEGSNKRREVKAVALQNRSDGTERKYVAERWGGKGGVAGIFTPT